MSPSRRLWLFFPVAVLTLFFAVLGWRNWHLPMNEEDVFAAIPTYYRSPMMKATDALNRSSGFGPSPFADNAITVICLKHAGAAAPVSAGLLARLQRSCPKARLVNFSKSRAQSECLFSFVEVQFLSRSQAKCLVSTVVKAPSPDQRDAMFETFILKRSPLNFKDTNWQLVKSTAISNRDPRLK